MPRLARTTLLAAALTLAAVLTTACLRSDPSFELALSVRTFIGTTTGAVAFSPPEPAPEPVAEPDGWNIRLDLARFTKLHNGTPALQIIMQAQSDPGASMELWLSDQDSTVARWSGGKTKSFSSPLCFQLMLEKDGEAVPLGDGQHTLTAVFRDSTGGVITAKKINTAGTPPTLTGATPAPGSEVFRDLYWCP